MSEAQTLTAAESLYQRVPMAFRFKKDKLGVKRPNVEISARVLTFDGVVDILKRGDEKECELLLEQINSIFRDVIAEKVGEDEAYSQETYDSKPLTWQDIVNMPKEDRRSSSIAKEVWDSFAEDYLAVMPGLTGAKVEATKLAVELFLKKMRPAQTNKPVLEKMKQRLAMYAETPNAEKFEEIITLLTRRIDQYLAADAPELLADNLG
jgi:hypothetical protein